MSVGQNIKKARKKAGMTQKELAQKLGLSFQSIAQWENDLRNPKVETLRKIANALECDPAELDSSLASSMSVGDNIRYWRKFAGMTQKDLAQKTGLDSETIQKYEIGKLEPSKKALQNVATALDELPEWFSDEDSWTPEQYALRDLATYIEILKQIHLDQKDNPAPITDDLKKTWGYHAIPSIAKKYAVSEDWLKSVVDSERYGSAASDAFEVAETLPKNIQRMIQIMDTMNSVGQQTAVERVSELAQLPQYQEKHPAGDSTQSAGTGDEKDPE